MAQNFSMLRKGVALPAGNPAARTVLPTIAGGIQDLMVYNPDQLNPLHLLAGGSAVVADELCAVVAPGQTAVFSALGATHISAYRPAGTTPGVFWVGEGQ